MPPEFSTAAAIQRIAFFTLSHADVTVFDASSPRVDFAIDFKSRRRHSRLPRRFDNSGCASRPPMISASHDGEFYARFSLYYSRRVSSLRVIFAAARLLCFRRFAAAAYAPPRHAFALRLLMFT